MARPIDVQEDAAPGRAGGRARCPNRRILLASPPRGLPRPEDFLIVEAEAAAPGPGEIAVEVTHLSIDPFERLRMARAAAGAGELVPGRGIGRVTASCAPGFAPGDWVACAPGWQEQAVVEAKAARAIDLALGPPERHLSLFGPSGLTACIATLDAGRAAAGETLCIAPGAGSVGSLAGQIAAHEGARAVGIGRGAAQCAAMRALGFAAAVDTEGDLDAQLAAACPNGIDLFLDGLGGAAHDAAVRRLAERGRVVLLGFVSGYCGDPPPRYGDAAALLLRRARVEGFLLADWESRFEAARARLAAWYEAGAVRPLESIWEGLESAPRAFAALFGEAPPGKQIVRLGPRG